MDPIVISSIGVLIAAVSFANSWRQNIKKEASYLQRLESKNSELADRLQKLENKAFDDDSSIREVSSDRHMEVGVLKEEIEELKSEVQSLRKEAARLQRLENKVFNTNSSIKEILSDRHAEVDVLKEEVEELKSEVQSIGDDFQSVKTPALVAFTKLVNFEEVGEYNFFTFPNLRAHDMFATGQFYSAHSIIMLGVEPQVVEQKDKDTFKYPWEERRNWR